MSSRKRGDARQPHHLTRDTDVAEGWEGRTPVDIKDRRGSCAVAICVQPSQKATRKEAEGAERGLVEKLLKSWMRVLSFLTEYAIMI